MRNRNRRRIASLIVTAIALSLAPEAEQALAGSAPSWSVRYATYLGGSAEDTVRDVALDAAGNLVAVGGTASPDFPTTQGAHDTTFNGTHDVFVAKLAPDGTLLWSTYLGGPSYDRAYAVELDAGGFIYVAGRAGRGFPTTPGVLQESFAGDGDPNKLYGEQDGFIAKLSPDGTQLVWSTYFGAGSRGFVRDLAVDAQGNLYAPFYADVSHPWITDGAFQTQRGVGVDGSVTKLDPNAATVVWSSYLAGNGLDLATPSIRVDDGGFVYVAGYTESTDLPTTPQAAQPDPGGGSAGDLMVARFQPDGSALAYLTYLGGSGGEFSETHALAIDTAGNLVVAATTTSADFPVTDGAAQLQYGGRGSGRGNYPGDGFVTLLAPDGSLVASTFLGGSDGEGIEGTAIDDAGRIVVGGATFSTDFPVSGGDVPQPSLATGADQFLAVLAPDLSQIVRATYLGGSGNADFGRTAAAGPTGAVAVAGHSDASDFPVANAAQTGFAGAPSDGTITVFAPEAGATAGALAAFGALATLHVLRRGGR